RAIRRMISDMQNKGMSVKNSYFGYRSYGHQAQLYNEYIGIYGKVGADRIAARPGHSEHQTGLAFDIQLGGQFEINWIARNAHRYGFIVRYPAGKELITGYQYEFWHLRYVGNKATNIYNSGKTLEEYYNFPGGGYK
ncbi:M15 family metallopeptidase, partial [Floricoccus penangensis]|uniref:M15 family metallopeptidase n=1 Tax=Floricoccus penangensis TaxID=1859475 RepID=UPI000A9ECBC7